MSFVPRTDQVSLFKDDTISILIFPILSAIVTKLLQQDLYNSRFPTLEARSFFKYGHPKKQLFNLHLTFIFPWPLKVESKERQSHGCDITANT